MIVPRFNKAPIDTSVVCRMTKHKPIRSPYDASFLLKQILIDVSEKTRISIKDICGKRRKREFVEARQIFCKRAREKTAYSLQMIGSVVNIDHSTVLSSINTINNVKQLREKYQFIYGMKPKEEIKDEVKELSLYVSPFKDLAISNNREHHGYREHSL